MTQTRSTRLRRFMESLIILDKSGQEQRLCFNPPQEMVWQKIQPALDALEPISIIALKARQEGVSTLTQALMFAYLHCFGAAEAITLAHDWDSSELIFRMNKRFYERSELPKSIPPRSRTIEVPTDAGSLIWRVMTAGSKAKGRGFALRALHLSEVAFWPNPDILLGILQAVPPPPIPTLTVMESTANGKTDIGEMFYLEWKRSMQGDDVRGMPSFVPVFLPWFAMPEYRADNVEAIEDLDAEEQSLIQRFQVDLGQLAWRRWYIRNRCQGDINRWNQEYPATWDVAFISSGIPAFDPQAIARQRVNVLTPSRWDFRTDGTPIPHSKGPLRLWPQRDGSGHLVMPPLPGHRYLIGADTCQGYGGDLGRNDDNDTRSWAAAEVFDIDTLEQAGEWHHPTPGFAFAQRLWWMADRIFNKPMLCIEMNYLGRTVQDRLKEQYNYVNLHPWKGKQDRVGVKPAVLYGWETTISTRGFLIDTAQEYIHMDKVTIRSEVLLEQLESFSKVTGGVYDADLSDDCAMAAMLSWRSRMENFYPSKITAQRFEQESLATLGIKVKDDPQAVWAKRHRRLFGEKSSSGKRWGGR